jgi:glutamyl-tRNA synthetase
MTKSVVTRFAPSPTGELHIGGARTALFNYLYAKHTGGVFRLRIEDTDRERSTPESVSAIFKGMQWLGIDHDGPVVFQSKRDHEHKMAAYDLLAAGHAYKCYLTADETVAQKVRGTAFRSPWRDPEYAPKPNVDTPFTIRFKGPLDGKTVVNDLVRGRVEFDNSVFDDMIILRSDSTPTYNLAVVVDDNHMNVNHVIRGDDHLNNAGRQTLLYNAFGWEVPVYAHIPLINGPDGKPLSKRHGATSVIEYKALGYLPEGMRNYLTRLGWGHGDDEIFSDAQAIEWFDVRNVVKAPARFDFKKLDSVNQHYINAKATDDLIELLEGDDPHVFTLNTLRRTIPLVKMGAPNIVALREAVRFALVFPDGLSEKTTLMLSDPENFSRHERLYDLLVSRKDDWEVDSLNQHLRDFVHGETRTMGAIGPTLRDILTGMKSAPDLGICLVSIGYGDSMRRLEKALGKG